MNYFTYNTSFGRMTVSSDGRSITQVVFGDARLSGSRVPSAETNACADQLLEYFSGKRRVFDLPIKMNGTDFQLSVWRALADIPYGQTRTPKELAELVGCADSYRLVSKAAYANLLPVIIPTHRLIVASGEESSHTRDSDLRRACRELERRFM